MLESLIFEPNTLFVRQLLYDFQHANTPTRQRASISAGGELAARSLLKPVVSLQCVKLSRTRYMYLDNLLETNSGSIVCVVDRLV